MGRNKEQFRYEPQGDIHIAGLDLTKLREEALEMQAHGVLSANLSNRAARYILQNLKYSLSPRDQDIREILKNEHVTDFSAVFKVNNNHLDPVAQIEISSGDRVLVNFRAKPPKVRENTNPS